MENFLNLNDKVVVVTGAASGIGRAIAVALVDAGAKVIATDINKQGIAEFAASCPDRIIGLQHDVTQEEGWNSVKKYVEDNYGHLDVLVNNAGIMVEAEFAQTSTPTLQRQLKINVESVYIGTRQLLPLLTQATHKNKDASVINISSIYGIVSGLKYSAYTASKGAIIALSKALSFELASAHIRVNTVLPGPVGNTLLAKDWEPPKNAQGELLTEDEIMAYWRSMIPLGRLGEVKDISNIVLFLASQRSSFITGADFVVDGGYTAH